MHTFLFIPLLVKLEVVLLDNRYAILLVFQQIVNKIGFIYNIFADSFWRFWLFIIRNSPGCTTLRNEFDSQMINAWAGTAFRNC